MKRLSLVLLIAILALVAAPAWAQITALGTDAFAHKVKGKEVWITTSDGQRHRGVIKDFSPTAIVMSAAPVYTWNPNHVLVTTRADGPEFAFDHVVRIDEVSHRLRNGIVTGAIIGTALWLPAAVLYGCGEGDGVVCAGWFAADVGAGVAVGAAIGKLMNRNPNRDLLYDSGRRTTVAVAPILSPTRKGVAFSMTWR